MRNLYLERLGWDVNEGETTTTRKGEKEKRKRRGNLDKMHFLRLATMPGDPDNGFSPILWERDGGKHMNLFSPLSNTTDIRARQRLAVPEGIHYGSARGWGINWKLQTVYPLSQSCKKML